MDTAVRIAGVCICGVCAALVLGERYRSAAILCTVSAFLSVFGFIVGGAVADTVSALETVYAETGFGEYASLLTKALGITYITSAASEICDAAGEGILARAVGIGGRAELLALCMPMILKLLETASAMLENI